MSRPGQLRLRNRSWPGLPKPNTATQKDTMTARRLERYTVETITLIGDSVAFVSTDGVVLCRQKSELAWIPEPGAQLLLETLDGCRVSGLGDGERWAFHYTDDDLAEQDRKAHDEAVKAQEAAVTE